MQAGEVSRGSFVSEVAAFGLLLGATAAVDGDGRRVLTGEARKKRSLGQYFTEGACWLQPQVVDFIRASACNTVYDPFAGSGCLFGPVQEAIPAITEAVGLDIDPAQGWQVNDSLLNIPARSGAIIVTNPPYITKYSASRKKLDAGLKRYFDLTPYDDVYLLALDRMLAAQEHVVAIIPETFINSPYKQKARLHSITILEENPFRDTDTPVVVVCFDSRPKPYEEIKLYKGADYICTLGEVEACRLVPTNTVRLRFNAPDGWLGVRCVDTTNPAKRLHFDFRERFDYNWEKGIKASSRLLTLVEIDVPPAQRQAFVDACNARLEALRTRSHDIVLSPFKGNMKNGVRRRRLDFQTCRAIIEQAYQAVLGQSEAAAWVQSSLFEVAL